MASFIFLRHRKKSIFHGGLMMCARIMRWRWRRFCLRGLEIVEGSLSGFVHVVLPREILMQVVQYLMKAPSLIGLRL